MTCDVSLKVKSNIQHRDAAEAVLTTAERANSRVRKLGSRNVKARNSEKRNTLPEANHKELNVQLCTNTQNLPKERSKSSIEILVTRSQRRSRDPPKVSHDQKRTKQDSQSNP